MGLHTLSAGGNISCIEVYVITNFGDYLINQT